MRMSFVLSLSLLAASPALADEIWTTALGQVAWETDIDTTAVLRLDGEDGVQVIRMFAPDLAADVMGGRGTYTGVWIANVGDTACVVDTVDPLGGKSAYWGTFTITFVHDAFPSDWAGTYGNCLDTPLMPIAGVALVGG